MAGPSACPFAHSAGHAALVRAGGRSGVTYLIAEPGRRYPASARDALARFGYAEVTPARVPTRVLALIPTGPALDPVAARTPVSN